MLRKYLRKHDREYSTFSNVEASRWRGCNGRNCNLIELYSLLSIHMSARAELYASFIFPNYSIRLSVHCETYSDPTVMISMVYED